MSATLERLPLRQAEAFAQEVLEDLSPVCELIKIAGSIRRRKSDVGDIEIVLAPNFSPGQAGLFEDVAGKPQNDLIQHLLKRIEEGMYERRLDSAGRPCFGERVQALTYKGFALDLFGVLPPAQWGVIFTIRTGSADFIKRVVRQRVESGTVLQTGQRVSEGCLWDRGVVVQTPTEESFFDAIGLPWLSPECRIG